MDVVRILIVDDHAIVREGTRQVLERDPTLVVVGEAGTAEEAVQLAIQLQPDVVLLDLALPNRNGIEATREIRRLAPAAKVLVLSAHDEEDYVLAAIDVGAAGYLLKTVRGREVVDAIHAVRQGQVVLHPAVVAKLRHSLRQGLERGLGPILSAREMEILQMAGQGLRNKEIGGVAGLSQRTVEGHLSHILAKLGVSSRTEAVVYAIAHHWLPLSGETE